MTINDELGVGGNNVQVLHSLLTNFVTKRHKKSLNVKMVFKPGTLAGGWWWWWVFCLKVRYALALVGLGCDQYPSTYYFM